MLREGHLFSRDLKKGSCAVVRGTAGESVLQVSQDVRTVWEDKTPEHPTGEEVAPIKCGGHGSCGRVHSSLAWSDLYSKGPVRLLCWQETGEVREGRGGGRGHRTVTG